MNWKSWKKKDPHSFFILFRCGDYTGKVMGQGVSTGKMWMCRGVVFPDIVYVLGVVVCGVMWLSNICKITISQ